MERWLREYASANLTPRTAEGYELIARRYLIPALGKITLTGLKPEHIQCYQSEKLSRGRVDGKGTLSPRTIRHHCVALHTALKEVVKLGLLSRNVADAVSPPSCSRHEWQHFDEFDFNTFIEAAKTSPYMGYPCSSVIVLSWNHLQANLSPKISKQRSPLQS